MVTELVLATVNQSHCAVFGSSRSPQQEAEGIWLHRAGTTCLMARVGTEGYRRHRDTTCQREASQDPRGPIRASGRNKGQGLHTGRGLPGAYVWGLWGSELERRRAQHRKLQEERQLWVAGWGGSTGQGIQKACC